MTNVVDILYEDHFVFEFVLSTFSSLSLKNQCDVCVEGTIPFSISRYSLESWSFEIVYGDLIYYRDTTLFLENDWDGRKYLNEQQGMNFGQFIYNLDTNTQYLIRKLKNINLKLVGFFSSEQSNYGAYIYRDTFAEIDMYIFMKFSLVLFYLYFFSFCFLLDKIFFLLFYY